MHAVPIIISTIALLISVVTFYYALKNRRDARVNEIKLLFIETYSKMRSLLFQYSMRSRNDGLDSLNSPIVNEYKHLLFKVECLLLDSQEAHKLYVQLKEECNTQGVNRIFKDITHYKHLQNVQENNNARMSILPNVENYINDVKHTDEQGKPVRSEVIKILLLLQIVLQVMLLTARLVRCPRKSGDDSTWLVVITNFLYYDEIDQLFFKHVRCVLDQYESLLK